MCDKTVHRITDERLAVRSSNQCVVTVSVINSVYTCWRISVIPGWTMDVVWWAIVHAPNRIGGSVSWQAGASNKWNAIAGWMSASVVASQQSVTSRGVNCRQTQFSMCLARTGCTTVSYVTSGTWQRRDITWARSGLGWAGPRCC